MLSAQLRCDRNMLAIALSPSARRCVGISLAPSLMSPGVLIMQACAALFNFAIGGWKTCGWPHLLFVTALSFVAHKIVLPAVKARKLEQEDLLKGLCVFRPGESSQVSKERLQGMT